MGLQKNRGRWPSMEAGRPGGLLTSPKAQHRASFRQWPRPPLALPGQGSLCPSPSYHRGPAGDELDRILHLLLGHLHHTAVLFLRGKGLFPILGHPGVQLWSWEGGEGSGPQAKTPGQQRTTGIPPAIALREPKVHKAQTQTQCTCPGVGLSTGETEACLLCPSPRSMVPPP